MSLADEQWQYYSSANLATPRVSSETPSVLALMLSKFGNKPFMKHEMQGYPPFDM